MHFLITSGGTREYIDKVRFISNASSGRMGNALVRAAMGAGHKVTLITTQTTQRTPSGIKTIEVETAAQMFSAVKKNFGRCDCLIMAAAVSDYTPAKPAKGKIKKTDRPLAIRLKPTADILAWAGRSKKKNQIVVGFALEDKAVRSGAEKKLKDKKLDMVIANTPEAIGAEKLTVWIKVAGEKWSKTENVSKTAMARKIVRLTEKLAD